MNPIAGDSVVRRSATESPCADGNARLRPGGPGRGPLLLSVVIPTLDEADTIGTLISDLTKLQVRYEVVVVDGGSADGTTATARRAGARVVHAPPGRGMQLRAGADAACAPLLAFLHADVRLTDRAAAQLSRLALAPPTRACTFRLRIAARGLRYRIIDMGANIRTRLFKLPYGDQGLIVRRQEYEAAGGYPPIPLFEDVALIRSLRRVTGLHVLDDELEASPRRWRRDGPLRRMVRNWVLLARYYAGVAPERLAKSYRPEVPTHE